MTVTGMMVVQQARSYKGKQEVPLGSNRGPFVQACQAATFLGGSGWPWCAAFVCYVCKELGVPLAYNSAGAHDLADHHLPAVPRAGWHAGMVVDFNIGTGHTGILVSHTADTVTTVDGNWSDSVVEHTLPITDVRKVWRIPGVAYTSTVAPALPRRELPPWVVVTSANGHSKVVFRAQKKRNLLAWLTTHNVARLFPSGITIKRGKAR